MTSPSASGEPQVSSDPARQIKWQATRGLMTEQAGTVTCKFPGCGQPARQAPRTGRPPGYCDNPEHTGVTAWRERKRLADAEAGVTTTDADVEQPVTMARETGAEMLRQMRDLAGKLTGVADRLTGAVTTLGDTGAVEAEIESARRTAERPASPAGSPRKDRANIR